MTNILRGQLAFSYLRFSTPEQSQGDSFRRQKEMAERYAQRHGLTLDNRSYLDLGISAFRGANIEKGTLGDFVQAVREGLIPKGSLLLIESLDRLSRNKPLRAVNMLAEICEAGITVVTLSDERRYDAETMDTDGGALMFALMVAVRAHEESDTKSKRLRQSWEKKRRDANLRKPMTAQAPGWLSLAEGRKTFHVIPERAAVVRRIYSSYLNGDGVHRIAQQLNTEGVPTFGRAAYWHRSYVKKILENPSVTGAFTPHIVEYDKQDRKVRTPLDTLPDYYPQIIEPETFARVRVMMSGKRAPSDTGNGRATVSHLFAGLAKCPHCRSAMIKVSKGSTKRAGYPSLVCSRAKAGAGCQYRGVRLDGLEATFLAHVEELLYRMPDGSPTLKDLGKRLRQEQEKLEHRIVQFADFIAEGGDGPPSPSIRQELNAAEAKLARVREDLDRVSTTEAGRSVLAQRSRSRELADALASPELDRAKVNAILRQMFERVYIHWDLGALDFLWQHGGRTRVLCEEL